MLAAQPASGMQRCMLSCTWCLGGMGLDPKTCRFALPPGHGEPMLSSMLGLVMTYIDLVGTYRLAPDQKKRAEKVR